MDSLTQASPPDPDTQEAPIAAYAGGLPAGFGEPGPAASRVPGEDLQSRVEAALKTRADKEARRVRVAVDGDTVILTGKVRSWELREALRCAAWTALGVGKVADRLSISY